jgi:hypothetical protein
MNAGQRRVMWERRLAAWRASGLALMPYCAGKGLSYSSMKRWRSQLVVSRSRAERRQRRVLQPGAGTLVPIAVANPISTTSSPMTGVEIRLRGGRAIVIGGEIDETRLSRLIGVVERAP